MATQLTDAIAAHVLGEIQEVAQQIDGLTQKIETAAGVSDTAAKNLITQIRMSAEANNEAADKLINSMPGAANKALGQASDAALTALSSEVGRIAQRIADDASTENRQKSFYIAAAVLSGFSIFFFGSGMAIGNNNIGALAIAGICLGIGVISGMLLCHFMISSDHAKDEFRKNQQEYSTLHMNFTEKEFQHVIENTQPKLSSSMQAACYDVLLGGLDADKAATKHRLIGGKVAIEVARLKIARNSLIK